MGAMSLNDQALMVLNKMHIILLFNVVLSTMAFSIMGEGNNETSILGSVSNETRQRFDMIKKYLKTGHWPDRDDNKELLINIVSTLRPEDAQTLLTIAGDFEFDSLEMSDTKKFFVLFQEYLHAVIENQQTKMDTILVGLEHSLNDEVIQDLTKLFKAVVRNVWIQTSSGNYKSLIKLIPAMPTFLTNSVSLEFVERILGALDVKTLMKIGMVRQILLKTAMKPMIQKFETALMAKLDLDKNVLKEKIEKYIFHMGKRIEKEPFFPKFARKIRIEFQKGWNYIKALFV